MKKFEEKMKIVFPPPRLHLIFKLCRRKVKAVAHCVEMHLPADHRWAIDQGTLPLSHLVAKYLPLKKAAQKKIMP